MELEVLRNLIFFNNSNLINQSGSHDINNSKFTCPLRIEEKEESFDCKYDIVFIWKCCPRILHLEGFVFKEKINETLIYNGINFKLKLITFDMYNLTEDD